MILGIGLKIMVVLCAAGMIDGGFFIHHAAAQNNKPQTVQIDPVRREVTETSAMPKSAEKENPPRQENGVFEPATLESEGGENIRGWKSLQCPKCQDGEDF